MLYDSDNSETFQSSAFLWRMCYMVQKYHLCLLRMSLPSVGINYCKRRPQWVAVPPICECKWHSFWPINHVNNTSRIRKGRQYTSHFTNCIRVSMEYIRCRVKSFVYIKYTQRMALFETETTLPLSVQAPNNTWKHKRHVNTLHVLTHFMQLS
jgi:hypothetical protein